VHISDMAHHRIRHPKDVLTVGDAVQVKVTEVDLDRRRIALSLKALTGDPWEGVASRYKVGEPVTGKVARVVDFGVFIDLEPGVTALLPASESGVPKGKPLGASFKPGKEVTLKVLRIEAAAQKMALTTRDEVHVEARGAGGGARGGARGGPGGRRDDRGRGAGPGGGRGAMAWSDPGEKETTDDGKALGSLGALLMAALDKPDEK